MTRTAASAGVNAEATEAWDGPLYEGFVRFRDVIVSGLAVHGDEALRLFPPQAGQRVLDVGCGFGDTTQRIAELVGPGGQAVGVDVAPKFIDTARRETAELGIPNVDPSTVDYGLLGHEREVDLLRALGEFPRVVSSAAELRAPHRVARYCEELAGTYHRFYDTCRVLPYGDEKITPLTVARLALCEATRVVLANGLGLLGVSAPERM